MCRELLTLEIYWEIRVAMGLKQLLLYMTIFHFLFGTALAEELETQRLRRLPVKDKNWVIIQTSKNRVTIVGLISKSTLKSLRESINEFPLINEIVVDSHGGDVESAIEIARIMFKKKLNLVVEGRCLSVCALFLFPAASNKVVLSNSVVAVHEMTSHILEGNTRREVSGNEIDIEIQQNSNLVIVNELKNFNMTISKFYNEIGVRPIHYAMFTKYHSDRKRYLGTSNVNLIEGNKSCPRYLGWMLDKQQLETSGIRGIQNFWYPQNEQERKRLYQANRIPIDSFFVGSGEILASYCQEKPIGWLKRQFNSLNILSSEILGRVYY